MSDNSIPGALPEAGGWASKQELPGATENSTTADNPISNLAEGSTPAADCWGSTKAKSPGATADQPNTGSGSTDRAERFASFGALLSAFIASSWCWLPPLLILGGISGAGMMAFMQDFRLIFMVVTFALLGSAFYLSYRPRRSTASGSEGGSAPAAKRSRRSKMMTFNRIMLWTVTVIVIVFLFFPQTVTNLFASGDELTADMKQTVITIEGMTWHTWAPTAVEAIESVPGVLAVEVDYETGKATIGTEKGQGVPKAEILKALEKKTPYRGRFVEEWVRWRGPLSLDRGRLLGRTELVPLTDRTRGLTHETEQVPFYNE